MTIIKHKGRFIRHKSGPIGSKQSTTATLPTYSFGDIISQKVVEDGNTFYKHFVSFSITSPGDNATKVIIQFSAGENAEIPYGEVEVPNVNGDYTLEISPPYLRQSYPISVRVRAQGSGNPCRADVTTVLVEDGGMDPTTYPDIYSEGDNDVVEFMGTSTLSVAGSEYPVVVGDVEWLWEVYDENGDLLDTFTTPTITAPNPTSPNVYTVKAKETSYDENGFLLNSVYTPVHDIVPFVDFPSDISTSDWTVFTITDADEAEGIVGRQKLTIVNSIDIPDGFRLYWYYGAVDSDDDTAFNNTLPLLNETDTVYKTVEGMSVGTVVYPKLYWERIADNAVQLASTRPSFPIQDIIVIPPVEEVVPPSYLRVSTGITSTPNVSHNIGNLLVAYVFTTGVQTVDAPDGTWTQIGSTQTDASWTTAIFYKFANSTTELSGITWPFSTKVFVYENVDTTDPIGATAYGSGSGFGGLSDDPGLTMEGINSLVLSLKSHNAGSGTLAGARSDITTVVNGSRVVAGNSTVIPVVGNWPAQTSIANSNNPGTNLAGYHSEAIEIKGVPVSTDPGGSWPSDINVSKWNSYSVTNPTESSGVTGQRASTITSGVTIPDGYRLFVYQNNNEVTNPTTNLLEFTSETRYVKTSGTLPVGTTIYPKLYWYRVSDSGWHLASTRPTYTVQSLVSPTEDIVVVDADDVRAAFVSAPGGRVIEVRSGNGGSLSISGISKSSTVTIRPNDRANPPVFSTINASNTNNVKLDGLTISVPKPVGLESGTRVSMQGANNWEVVDCLIEGGLTGFTGVNSSNGKFWYNTVRRNGRDCVTMFGSIRNVEISHNLINDFNIDLSQQKLSNMHPDAVQFNCNLKDAYSADVTVSDNIMDCRQIGADTHGFFNGKEAIWKNGRPLDGVDNPNDPWELRPCGSRRFHILRNFVRGNHRDGIFLQGFIDSEVIGNKVIRVTSSTGNTSATVDTREAFSPIINLAVGERKDSDALPPPYFSFKNITIDNNVVSQASNGSFEGQPWRGDEGWGTGIVVTRHVITNNENTFPIGWVTPVAGQYSRGNGP
jgi:hypothetical protein